jgi:hypothetical protein
MRDVLLKGVEVGNLGASEVGSDHGTTPLPRCAICIEDAMPKDRYESGSSSWSQFVVLEVGRQNSLYILGFNGGYNYQESVESATLFYTDHTICSKQAELHGVVAIHEEPLPRCLVRSLFLAGRYNFLDEVDAQRLAEDAFVGILVCWLAAMFLDHPPPASTSGEFIVGTLEHQKSKDRKEQYLKWGCAWQRRHVAATSSTDPATLGKETKVEGEVM